MGPIHYINKQNSHARSWTILPTKAKTFCCHTNSAFVLFCFSALSTKSCSILRIRSNLSFSFVLFCFSALSTKSCSVLRIRSNLSFSLLPLMMLLLQPFVFLNPIRLDCLTIVIKSLICNAVTQLQSADCREARENAELPQKPIKSNTAWKSRQLLFTTAITFNYNRLQKKSSRFTKVSHSRCYNYTLESSYNYQKSETKNLAFNRREKNNQHANNGEAYNFRQRTSQLCP